MKDIEARAMRLAVYIRELGVPPVALRGADYLGWERALQKQYQQLRESLGKEAGQAARVRGRSLIRKQGLREAVGELVPPVPRTDRKKGSRAQPVHSDGSAQTSVEPMAAALHPRSVAVPNPVTCQRKYRHVNFLTAMLHARRIHSPGLHVYPCDICDGLHVGHDLTSEQTKRARAVRKRLRSIDRQLASLVRQSDKLRKERQSLLTEQGLAFASCPSDLGHLLLRLKAWLLRQKRGGEDG